MALDDGILQAYLDRELTDQEAERVEVHLVSCAQCRVKLEELRNNSNFAQDVLARYEKAHQQMPVNTDLAWGRFADRPVVSSSNQPKGWMIMFKTHRKAAIAAGLILVLSCSLFLQPVRTAAGQFLSIFRVQQIQTVSISPEQLDQISKIFKENRGSLNIQNFGEVKVTGDRRPQVLTKAELQSRLPGVLLPDALPGGFTLQSTALNSPCRVELKLKLANINALLQSLGTTKLLPAELDGKTFAIQIPEVVGARFNNNRNHLILLETHSPELIVPNGVSAESIRDTLLQLPFLPPELVTQLRAINDWQHTMVVPSSAGNAEPVTVGGNSGIYFSAAKNAALIAKFLPEAQAKMEQTRISENIGFVVWQVHDTIFLLGGNIDKNALVSLAGSVR